MAALLLLLACGPAKPVRSRPLFRHVITDAGEIWLGKALPLPAATDADPAWVIMSSEGDGTQRVGVTRAADGVVREIITNYPQRADFATLVTGYSAAFGPPAAHHRRPLGPESAEVVTWADTATKFELTRDPRRSVSTIFSRLSDRSER